MYDVTRRKGKISFQSFNMAGYILVKDVKKGDCEIHHNKKPPTEHKLDRGALLIDIPPNERIPREDGGPSHNYTLYADPRVTLYDDGTCVCPLREAELDYLTAIGDPQIAFNQYKQDKLSWITDLKIGDIVYFRLPSKSTSSATVMPKAKVKYYGPIPYHNGVMFGLEIMEPQYRGKGTTDGSPHFNCGPNNAVYVAMDKITKKANERDNDHPKESEGGDGKAISEQPRYTEDGPASNTRGKKQEKTFIEKAKGKLKEGWKAATSAPPTVTPTPHAASDVPSQFSINDRVVLQPVDGGVVKGIVRWAGPVRMGRESGNIVIPVVGIETSRPVNHETEFPGLTYSVTGSHGTELFEVPCNHGRIFVAEQIVLSEEEHKQQKKEEDTEEMREAKKFGLSLEEFRRQRDIHIQAKIAKERKDDGRPKHPPQEEEDLTGGNGLIGNTSNEQDYPIKPDGTPILSEQSMLGQEELLENLSKQRKTDDGYVMVEGSNFGRGDNDGGVDNTPSQEPPPIDPEKKLSHQSQYHSHEDQHISNTNRRTPPIVLRQHSSDRTYKQSHPQGQDGRRFLDDTQQQQRPEPRIRRHDNTSPSLPSRTDEHLGYHGDRYHRDKPSSTREDLHPGHHGDVYSNQYGGIHPDHHGGVNPSHHGGVPPGDRHSSHPRDRYHGEGEHYRSNDPSSSHQYENFPSSAASGSGPTPRLSSIASDPTQFTIGIMVEIPMTDSTVRHGIIRWIGQIPGFQGQFAGIELDYPLEGCRDGTFSGMRYFTCPPGKGFFSLLTTLQLDTRFIEPHQVPAAKRQELKNPLAHISQYDDSDTPGGHELFSKYIGEEHGIQGHHNSCYLDATVFGLFALSDSFDSMLLEEPHTDIGKSIKYILWKGIVNPLRRYGVARFESIMELRNELETLGRMKGANKDEKDPEEFLNLLFKEILHVEPFISIKRPFGVENEFFVQLFFEVDNSQTGPPGTEKLIRQMFHEQKISFTTVPSKLLLQMPRFGKEFKMFNKIIPSLEMNVKPLLDPASRGIQNCRICKELKASYSCDDCQEFVRTDDDSTVYLCDGCSSIVHKNRGTHKPEQLPTNRSMGDASAFSKMELLSVICIETSHYVCFTRADDKWLFHDSMADRVYDTFNIPRVTDVSRDLNHWVYNPDNHQKLLQSPSRDIPECVRRFTQDIYMCVYINPNLDRYGGGSSLESLPPVNPIEQNSEELQDEVRQRKIELENEKANYRHS